MRKIFKNYSRGRLDFVLICKEHEPKEVEEEAEEEWVRVSDSDYVQKLMGKF